MHTQFRLQNKNASVGLKKMRRDADALANWLNRRGIEKENIDEQIRQLADKSYTSVAFSKMANVKKFIAYWRAKDEDVIARLTSSTGPTIEHPNEVVRNAYYVKIEKVKLRKKKWK